MKIANKFLVPLTLALMTVSGSLSFAETTPEGARATGPNGQEANANCAGQEDCTPPTAANEDRNANTNKSVEDIVAQLLKGSAGSAAPAAGKSDGEK